MEVAPGTSHPLMRSGEQSHRFATPTAARLATGNAPLCPPQMPLRYPEEARVGNGLPSGQCGERFQAKVNTGFLAGDGKRLDRYARTRETGVPAICFPADGDR